MTAHPLRFQRAAAGELFIIAICELLEATRAHDQAKAAAKNAIMDEYRKGQLAEWGVLDLIQKHGLKSA